MTTLAAYREQECLTVSELARRSDLGQPDVSRAEAGAPTLFTSIRLAIGTRGAVLPWKLHLKPKHRRALRQFFELAEQLTIERLEREGRLREAV